MMLEDIVTISAAVLAVIIALVAYRVSLRREDFGVLEDVKTILHDVHKRLDLQDNKIVDQQVKLDLLDLRVQSVLPSRLDIEVPTMKGPTHENSLSMNVTSHKLTSQTWKERKPGGREGSMLNLTDVKVLKIISSEAKTPGTVQAEIRRSREHTARMLKRLCDEGYLSRSGLRPYLYSLTEKGRKLI